VWSTGGLAGSVVHRLAVQLSSKTGNISGFSADEARLDVPMPQNQGLYGLSVTVTGETADGFSFERTFVRSLAVADIAVLVDNPWQLEQLVRP